MEGFVIKMGGTSPVCSKGLPLYHQLSTREQWFHKKKKKKK